VFASNRPPRHAMPHDFPPTGLRAATERGGRRVIAKQCAGLGGASSRDRGEEKTMVKCTRWPLALALALAPVAAPAAPATGSTAVALRPAAAAVVTLVQFRRGGFGLGLGLGIGVLGAVIANEAYRPRPGPITTTTLMRVPITRLPTMPAIRAACARSTSAPSSGTPGSTRLIPAKSGFARICA